MTRKLLETFDIDGVTNAAATDHTVFTTGVNTNAEVDITIVNRHGTTASDVNVALVPAGATLDASHYIEYTKTLAAKTSMKLTDIKLEEGDFIVINSANADVNVVINGIYYPESD